MRWLCPALLLLATSGLTTRAADRPNVVFLLSDDQHFQTIRALGNAEIHTPHLDRLVRDGFVLRNCFCMGSTVPAVCIPSRAMLLTGRSLFRVSNQIAPEHATMPQTFGAAGYVTHGIGKWHNGPASFARSFQGGGSIFFGGMSDQRQMPVQDFDPAGKYPRDRSRPGGKFSSDLFADEAVRFLRAQRGEKPFFLYVAFTSPHDPRTPPPEFARLYDPAKLTLPKAYLPVHPFNNGEMLVRDEALAPWPRTPEEVRRHTADYYGMISNLDAQVGRIRAALQENGQADRTLIVFASDHGLALGRHGLFGKQSLYDHSMRPPVILAGPGVPKGGSSEALCYLYDLFPTLCALAGVKTPSSIEGAALLPRLPDVQAPKRGALLLAYRTFQRAVRTDRWKMIRYPHLNKSQLFDLNADPEELRDLAGDPGHAQRLAELMKELTAEQAKAGDTLPLSTDTPQPLTIPLPGRKQ